MNETSSALQFETAEPTQATSAEVCCTDCGVSLASYYEVNGRTICEACQRKVVAVRKASHVPGMLRALGLGLLAAALGAGIYYAIAKLTEYEFGLIAIVVGLLVGLAVRRGARGRGGWRYQALAMFLTYASICSTYVPQLIAAVRAHRQDGAAASAPSSGASGASTAAEGAQAPTDHAVTAGAEHAPPKTVGIGQLLVAVGLLFALALALPFLAGLQNLMGLVIIAIGLYEAWKVNRAPPFSMNGPFTIGARAQDG